MLDYISELAKINELRRSKIKHYLCKYEVHYPHRHYVDFVTVPDWRDCYHEAFAAQTRYCNVSFKRANVYPIARYASGPRANMLVVAPEADAPVYVYFTMGFVDNFYIDETKDILAQLAEFRAMIETPPKYEMVIPIRFRESAEDSEYTEINIVMKEARIVDIHQKHI